MGREIIAFCMGEKGGLSRIAAPLLGSYLSYASLEKGAESAPGQFTAAEMKRILKVLANAR
jgi:3-dehydroquinate dehydratase type I